MNEVSVLGCREISRFTLNLSNRVSASCDRSSSVLISLPLYADRLQIRQPDCLRLGGVIGRPRCFEDAPVRRVDAGRNRQRPSSLHPNLTSGHAIAVCITYTLRHLSVCVQQLVFEPGANLWRFTFSPLTRRMICEFFPIYWDAEIRSSQ